MTTTVVTPPQVPSKYDVIPIHTSDIATYLSCRRKWDWTSPARNNLRHKVQIFGVNENLWFGSGIHYALEMYYNPALQRDPVEAFTTWFELQWNGGEVTEDFLDRCYDLNPKQFVSTGNEGTSCYMYKIAGLRDLLPNPIEDEFLILRELGIGMMEFYKEYAAEHDDFEVVAAETVFSVPLGFEAIDVREESPNFGKSLEVHARGKRDSIVYWPAKDRFGLFDHKTAAKVDEGYFAHLDKDPQTTNYIWASQQEAAQYDLPYKKIEQLCYQALRKVFPKPPTALQNGTPSLNRQDESCTAKMFEDYIRENNLTVWFEANDKAKNYYEFLLKEGDERFVVRRTSYRNQAEVQAAGEHIRMIAKEMLSPDTAIYPNPRRDWDCVRCAFRAPCIAKDDGSDWKGMLADGYELNSDR